MQIHIRFLCVELPPGAGDGPLSLPEGATVEQALREALASREVDLSLDACLNAVFLCNDRPVGPSTPLQGGDRLTVIRTLEGG